MRIALATLFTFIASAALTPAHADPYRWCANYGSNGDDGGTNCYFMTLEQCRATVSGIGGYCGPNAFYDGRPVETPGSVVSSHRKRRTSH